MKVIAAGPGRHRARPRREPLLPLVAAAGLVLLFGALAWPTPPAPSEVRATVKAELQVRPEPPELFRPAVAWRSP